MQELSLMVIDEGQQYGTDREIAVISLLQQQPLIIWTGDAEQTPGGIARTAPNAKRSRQLLLAKKHGLRSARKYCTPATLANAMTAILSSSSNDQLAALANTLDNGEHSLGQMWTDDLPAKYKQDLTDCQQLLPGATGIFREATTQERARRPSVVDPELLDGNSIDFRLPGQACIHFATRGNSAPDGWGPTGNPQFRNIWHQQYPRLGIDVTFFLESQSCDIPRCGSSEVPRSMP